jgi:hypothetical protein
VLGTAVTVAGAAPPAASTLLKESTVPNQAQPYEPLTSDNAAVVLVDHQVGLMTGVRDYSIAELSITSLV